MDDWFFLWHACDKTERSLSLLASLERGPKHVFAGILEMLPEKEQRKIAGMRPEADDNNQMKRAAYAKQYEYIKANKALLFPKAAQAHNCTRHAGLCTIEWQCAEDVPPSQCPLRENFSGPLCKPWTPYGQRLKDADETIEFFHLWVARMSESDYDLVFLENSELFEWFRFRDAMLPRFEVYYIINGIQDMGFPMGRVRLYGVAINRATMLWAGPSENNAVVDSFNEIFGCKVMLDADVYAGLDSTENIHAHKVDLAHLRGMYSDIDALPMNAFFSPCAQETLKTLEAMYRKSIKTGANGALVGDLSQSPSRVRAGPWLPAMARSSLLMSFSRQHIFTPNEIDFAMGWPVVDILAPDGNPSVFPGVLPPQFKQLDRTSRRIFAGNGMCLQQVMAWYTYCHAHVIRRSDCYTLYPHVRLPKRRASEHVEQIPAEEADEGGRMSEAA